MSLFRDRLYGWASLFHLKRIVFGLRAFVHGWATIRKRKLYSYVVLPGVLSLFTGTALAIFLLFYFVNLFQDWLRELGLPGWLDVLAAGFAFFTTFLVFIFSFRLLAALWIVPFLGPMQEKLEEAFYGERLRTTLGQDIVNALRGFWASLWQALLSLVLLISTIFLGPLQILFIMPFEAYFNARSLMILFIEKEHKMHSERKKKLREFRPEMLGLGLGYVLCLFLPGAGVILAPSIGLAGAAEIYFSKASHQ